MKAKQKPIFALIISEDALASSANRYVSLKLDLARRTAAHEKRIAELNAAFDAENAEAVRELAGLESSAQLYCETNKELFEGAVRHREYRNAKVGFRTNPPRVAKYLTKDTFDAIAERLAELPWGEPYVKHSLSLDKEALLTHRADFTEAQMRQAGFRFEQGETFYIEPAFASVEGVRKDAEAA